MPNFFPKITTKKEKKKETSACIENQKGGNKLAPSRGARYGNWKQKS